MGTQPPTIYEVARRAGVSIATVSRVQRGSDAVAAGTRDRVLEAIRGLDYRPNPLGRSLAERRHGATGVVFPDLSGPYYSEVILGFEREAASVGGVLILATHGRPDGEALVADLARRVDGLLVMGRTVPDEAICRLRERGLPVVLLARPPACSVASVRAENIESALRLTSHLIAHGHRRLAFVGDPSSSPDASLRWQGFREAHRRARLTAPRRAVLSSFREREGYRAVARVLDRRDPPTAVVCANDEIALGAYEAAGERRRAIPGDVAITGWDDIPVARFLTPALTTVRQPMRQLGERAARLLSTLIRGERPDEPHQLLPSELVIRASCGCGPNEGGSAT